MRSSGRSSPEPGASRRRGRPPILSRARIVEAALRVVRRDGRERLTMRGLAEELGASPMALYGHVRSREELLQAVGALALERVEVEVREGGSWTEQLEAWLQALQDRLLEHPELRELIAQQQNDSPALLRAIRAPIRILRDAGFELPAAVRGAQGLLWVAIGFFFVRSLGARYPRADSPGDQLASALSKLPDAERPDAKTIVPHLASREGDTRALYAAVVRRLVAGLAGDAPGADRLTRRREPRDSA